MKPDEARRLLGGYSTGTLSPEEQQALFAAALEDQGLFDELAREQALKEALDDPGVRAELLDAVNTGRSRGWLRWWPAPVGAALLAGFTVMLMVRHEEKPVPAVVAEYRAPTPVPAPPAAQEPKPEVPSKVRLDNPAPAVVAALPAVQARAPEVPHQVRLEEPGQFQASVEKDKVQPPPMLEPPAAMKAIVPAAPAANAIVATAGAPSQKEERAVVADSVSVGALRPAPSRALAKRLAPGGAALALRYSWSGAALKLEPAADGFLYLLNRTPGGEWTVVTAGGIRTVANVAVTVLAPEGGELLAVWSRTALEDPVAASQTPGPAVQVTKIGARPQ